MRKTLALLLIFLAVILAQFSAAPQPAQASTTYLLPVLLLNRDGGENYCLTYSDSVSLYQRYCESEGVINLYQQWLLLPRSGRTQVNIRTHKTNKCMQYASATDTISMVTCDLTKIEQCWDINYKDYPSSTSNPQIKACSAMTKSIQPVSNEVGAAIKVKSIQYYSTLWHIMPSETNNIQIKSLWSGKCMDVDTAGFFVGYGASVQQWTCLGIAQTNQLFTFERIPEHAYYYWIKAQHSGRYLCPEDYGTTVKQCGGVGVVVDSWEFAPIGAFFQIRSITASYSNPGCTDLNNNYPATQNGVDVGLWECLGIYQDNQLWRLWRITP